MIEPAKRFAEQVKTNRWRWLDVVDSELFTEAVNAAMLEMQIRNSSPPDMASAASYQWRTEGAKQFLAILMGLTASKTPAAKPDPGNLNWKA